MKLRYKLRTILQFIYFAFYPKVTVCVCVVAAVIIDLILGYSLINTSKGCVSYDILLAILTGVTASFIVWHISQNCKDISKSIDILEKEILKKPYYGTLLKFERKLPKKSIKDPIYQMDYEREKRRLEKLKNK